jgi:hypothetical protein
MKKKIYHAVEIVPKFIRKIVESVKIDTPTNTRPLNFLAWDMHKNRMSLLEQVSKMFRLSLPEGD